MALENDIDGLQVKFGCHVADRPIFVVKFLGRVGAIVIAYHQMFEHFPVAVHVIAEVHRQETAKLQEAGINLAPRTGIIGRHGCDDILLEPAVRAFGRQRVDSSRRFARVDRATHHRQRFWATWMLVGAHHRCSRIAGHRGLADGEHMCAPT